MLALEFVNISNPNEIRNPQNQIVIRRRARKRDTKNNLGVRKLSQVIRHEDLADQTVYSETDSPLRFNITTSYPAGPFPVKLNSRATQIVTFVMQGFGSYCPLKELWWNMGLFDSTAFLITLANASRMIDRYTPCGINETPEAITYYTKSVRSLQRRIDSLEEQLSEGVMIAILEFAYYDFVSQNLARWFIHMNGFQAIIARRGGIQTLRSSSMIRLLCFWIDVSGSFIFDRRPYFSPPHHLLHNVEHTLLPNPLLSRYISHFLDLAEVMIFLSETTNLTTFIDTHFKKSRVMEDDGFLSRTFNIYVHKLLSLPRLDDSQQDGVFPPRLIVQEAIRRASMILFALLREKFSIIPSGVSEHKNLIKELILQHEIDWAPYLELRLWTLAIAALAADGSDFQWYIDEICGTATQMGLLEWDEVQDILRQILWMGETFKIENHIIEESFGLENTF